MKYTNLVAVLACTMLMQACWAEADSAAIDLAEADPTVVDPATVACGRPDFNRLNNRGVFIWQNCGSGDWFLRASNGGVGDEFQVEGRLRSSRPLTKVNGFSLEAGQDTLDTTDLNDIRYRLRVFGMAQDGFDFSVTDSSTTCLAISTSSPVPLIFGAGNLMLNSPVNLATLSREDCAGGVLPPIMLLLDDDV